MSAARHPATLLSSCDHIPTEGIAIRPAPHVLASAILAGGLGLSLGPASADTIIVTTLAATGEGSLAAAFTAAAASREPSTIFIAGPGEIALTEGLVYTGAAPLALLGNGVTLSTTADITLLTATAATDLTLRDVTLQGPGDWSIENRADGDGTAGKGLFVDVPEDADGTVTLRLTNVTVRGVASHGIHISDCTLADDCGSGEGGEGEGSAASILLEFDTLTIEDVGFGRFDSDGLRADERGEGSITLRGLNLVVRNVGADGVELDEGQAGDVAVDILHGTFVRNGAYCAPDLLTAFLPDPSEAEFRESATTPEAIPGPVAESPDNSCFERDVDLHDDGSVEAYEFAIDVDDGFDIDEAGPGSIFGSFSVMDMSGNFDEGFDFDEAGPGDIDVTFTGVTGAGNADDALKLSEADGGNLFLLATGVELVSNGGAGIVAEEGGAGNVSVVLVGIATAGNHGGDMGVEVTQDGAGTGAVYIIDSEIADGIETEGAPIDAD